MILAPITINLKERLLILRSTGEIWPVSPNDVQFVMPKSLVPADLADAAWHPDLLRMWMKGDDIGVTKADESSLIGPEKAKGLMDSRRKIAALLRRVMRETERMQGRLLGGSLDSGRGGGMDALWEGLAPTSSEQRGSVSAAQAAEYLLNKANAGEEGGAKRIGVKAGTLPAFAAHQLLMGRPDLFLAYDLNMYEMGTFMVRSRTERERFDNVERLVQTQDPEFLAFVEKANVVREAVKSGADEASLPEWTESERDILYHLALALIERRGTQAPYALGLACSIAKWFSSETDAVIDLASIGPFVNELGIMPAFDSSMTSKLVESASRAADMGGFAMPASFGAADEPVAADAALDSLRTDHSHRVYVIDDPSALELDDGIALEKAAEDGQYWVHMHVADPTRFIERDGTLSRASSFVGTAHYLDEGVVPMLPPSLAGGKLSLGAGGDGRGQAVLVFSARLDKAGTVHDWKVGMGFTKNTVVTTYDAVNDVLGFTAPAVTHPFGKLAEDLITRGAPRALDSLEAEHTDELKTLLELSIALRAERFKSTGFEWTGPQSAVSVHNTPAVPRNIHDRGAMPSKSSAWTPRSNDDMQYGFAVTREPAHTSSISMVTEFMVLANQIAAWFCSERGLAVAFRGSGPVLDTSSTPAHMTVDKLLEQRVPGTGYMQMSQAKIAAVLFPATQLAPTPLPHWSMGLNAGRGYVWATSPLRRYDDMLAHWQIKGALAAEAGVTGGEGVLSENEIWPLVKSAYFGQQRGRSAQRTAHRFFTAGLLGQRSTGPLPEGYEIDPAQAVDLRAPLEALVIGPPLASAGMYKVEIMIPALGVASEAQFGSRAQAAHYAVGDKINVVLASTQQWPIPVHSFKLAPTSA